MAIQKYRLQKINANESTDIIHLETSSDMVIRPDGTNVENVLQNIPVSTNTLVIGTTTSGHTESDCDFLCDGMDDNEEFQNAINLLQDTGGTLYILPGVYHFTNHIYWSSRGGSYLLRLVGQSVDAVIFYKDYTGPRPSSDYVSEYGIAADGLGSALIVANGDMEIQHIWMRNSEDITNTCYGGTFIYVHSHNVIITNCYFTRGFPNAITVRASATATIVRCNFISGGFYKDESSTTIPVGVIVYGASHKLPAYDSSNTSTGIKTVNYDNGFLINITTTPSYIAHNEFTYDINYAIRAGNVQTIAYNAGYNAGIILDGASTTRIIGNSLADVKIRNHSKAIVVMGNHIRKTIEVADSFAVMIHDNWLGSGTNSWTKLIAKITGRSTGVSIMSNFIYSFTNYGAASIDVAVEDTSSNSDGTGNTVANNTFFKINTGSFTFTS